MEGEQTRGGHSFNTKTRPVVFDINILVVDDDATSLAVVAGMLRALKYGVVTARNPLDALATLRMQKFDLVITDLHMPIMDGLELQKHVKEEFKLPVIMISADEEASVILESLDSGAAFYMVKPVSSDILKSLWQYAVAAKKDKSVGIEERGSCLRGDSSGEKVMTYDHISSASSSRNGVQIRRTKHSKTIVIGKKKVKVSKGAKKAKVVWTTSLHNRFLQALRHIGLEKAVPKKILEFMSMPGLTRENVASHLQKYRLFLKRVAEKGTASALKGMSDRALRSTFAAGIPPHLLRNVRKANRKFPGQRQMSTSTDLPVRFGGDAQAPNASLLGPFSSSNGAGSSGASLPQFGYGQSSFTAPNTFGLTLFPKKEALASNFVPQLEHGRWDAFSNQANVHQPFFGNTNPLYQANLPASAIQLNNLGSNFPSRGDMTHGIMNARSGLINGGSSTHINPQQTEPNFELFTSGPLNYNFGTSGLIRDPHCTSVPYNGMGSLNSSIPPLGSSYTSHTYAGIKLSNEGDLVVAGAIGDGRYGLMRGKNDNTTLAPVGNGTSEGGYSATGFESANQLPPVFNAGNQQENVLLMPPQSEQLYGLGNGGKNHYAPNYLLDNISDFNELSSVQQLDEIDDLDDLFSEQTYNQPPYQSELEATSALVKELQNLGFSGSSCVQENPPNSNSSETSFLQHQAAGEQVMDVDFAGNMCPPVENPYNQHPAKQQENGRELADSDELFGMYQGENNPSESHPFLNQDWEDEFLDSLFSRGPYIADLE